MTVIELINQLQKVETKTATVYKDNSDDENNIVGKAVIERDLRDDEIVVVLKQW